MNPRSATANRFMTWLAVIAFGALAGYAYTTLVYDTLSPDLAATYPGLRTGALVAGLSSAFEIFFMRGDIAAWFRQRSFLTALGIRAAIHTVLVVAGLLLTRLLNGIMLGGFDDDAFDIGDILRDTVYSFIILAISLFVLQMRTLIGGRTLLNVILGRYHRPVREERLFLFVDLAGSTPLAAAIGDERFHEFLSAFFAEIDAAVVAYGGEIYAYIGDAMIASWKLGDDIHNGHAVEAIIAARRRLSQRASWFVETFGQAPQFRAVLHGGPIVAGECGDSRRQITYLGDVLNTTARLESLAKDLDIEILVSRDILARIELPDGVVVADLGQHELKGLAHPMAVHELTSAPGLVPQN